MHQTETTPDDTGIPEDFLYPGRSCISDNIKVLRLLAHQQITDSTTDNVGIIAMGMQLTNDKKGVRIYFVERNGMFIFCIDYGLLYRTALCISRITK